MKIKKALFLTITTFLGAAFFSGCGEKAGGGAAVQTQEPRRLIVSYAGEVDYGAFASDSVVSLRALGENGTPSEPFGAVKTFSERRFIGENLPIDILARRGFVVEFRDKEILSRPVWELEKGYNSVGLVSRGSTFVAENIMEVLKEEDIGTLDLAFFIAHFGDVEIEAAKLERNGEEWKEWGRSFRALMQLWARRPDGFEPEKFPDGVFGRNVGAGERKRMFDSALAFLFVISGDETGEYKKWAPRVFHAAAEMFLSEAAEALVGESSEPKKIREATGVMFELRDAFAAKYLPAGAKPVETEYEKTDTQFMPKVMDDNYYDARRKQRYLVEDMERMLKYDIPAGAAGNLAAFFEIYNKAMLKNETLDEGARQWAPVKEKDLKEYLRNAPDAARPWTQWMKRGKAAKKKEGAGNEGKEPAVEEPGNTVPAGPGAYRQEAGKSEAGDTGTAKNNR